jgi:hypothetical protein
MLPMNFKELASGNQLRDAYKKVIVKTYQGSNVSAMFVIMCQC